MNNIYTNHKAVFIVIILSVVMALTIFIMMQRQNSDPARQSDTTQVNTLPTPSPKIIARIGRENIYESDLDAEKKKYTENQLKSTNPDILLQKLKIDSAILQKAEEEKLIKLENTFFGMPTKDYVLRLKKIEEVRDKINSLSSTIEGEIVSLWFMNVKPGKAGYEEGKKIAFAKMAELHNMVQSGEISMKEAGDIIIADSSLASIDESYDANAYYLFSKEKAKSIFFDEEFDAEIKKLNTGDISRLALIKDYEDYGKVPPKKDALYVFAKVNKIDGSGAPYEQWVTNAKQKFGIK